MKVTLENTYRVIEVVREGHVGGVPVQGRVWQGYTESGIPVCFIVTRVVVAAEFDQSLFQHELQECEAPPRADALIIPLRFIV